MNWELLCIYKLPPTILHVISIKIFETLKMLQQADLNQYQSLDDVYDNVFRALSSVSTSEESYLANGLARAEDVLEAGKQGYNRTHYQRVVIVYASAYKYVL